MKRPTLILLPKASNFSQCRLASNWKGTVIKNLTKDILFPRGAQKPLSQMQLLSCFLEIFFFWSLDSISGNRTSLVIFSQGPLPIQIPTVMLPRKWLTNINRLSTKELIVGRQSQTLSPMYITTIYEVQVTSSTLHVKKIVVWLL